MTVVLKALRKQLSEDSNFGYEVNNLSYKPSLTDNEVRYLNSVGNLPVPECLVIPEQFRMSKEYVDEMAKWHSEI